jgi:hypothetical protein
MLQLLEKKSKKLSLFAQALNKRLINNNFASYSCRIGVQKTLALFMQYEQSF